MRTATVKHLADGMFNALTNVNGGSTHCNVSSWIYWQHELDEQELKMLYDRMLENVLELYAKHGVTEADFIKMLPPRFERKQTTS